MFNPIFQDTGDVEECWVNLYDRGGECKTGIRWDTRAKAKKRAHQRPFARVHVIPKTNPKAQEVFS